MSKMTIERVQLNNDGMFNIFKPNNKRTWPVIVTARVSYMSDGVTPAFAYVSKEQLVALGADASNVNHDLCWMMFESPEDEPGTGVEAVLI